MNAVFSRSFSLIALSAKREAKQVASRHGINFLVDLWLLEGVLGAVFVEISVVGARPPLVRVLLADEDGVGEPLRMEDFSEEPAASSLASSFLMASYRSSAKRRTCCRLGVALGSTFSECSISLLGTLGMSIGFQAKMSRLAQRKLTSVSSYFGSRPAPIMVVLLLSPVPRSIALTCTSSDG
jgi:hypothetical protein